MAIATASASAAALRKRMRELRVRDVEADANASFDLFDPICVSCRVVSSCVVSHPACAVYSCQSCVSTLAVSVELRAHTKYGPAATRLRVRVLSS